MRNLYWTPATDGLCPIRWPMTWKYLLRLASRITGNVRSASFEASEPISTSCPCEKKLMPCPLVRSTSNPSTRIRMSRYFRGTGHKKHSEEGSRVRDQGSGIKGQGSRVRDLRDSDLVHALDHFSFKL